MLFLPSWVTISILPDGRWRVGLLNGEKGCHDNAIVGTAELPALLAEWRDNPEEAFRRWWDLAPPSHRHVQAGPDGYVRGERPVSVSAPSVSLDDF